MTDAKQNSSAALVERTLMDRKAVVAALLLEIETDQAGLSDFMDDGPRYEAAFGLIAAKKSRVATIQASLAPLEADLAAARVEGVKAQDRADLAAFEKRKKRAAPGRRARYERAAAELVALAREMEAERREAEELRHRGLGAQPEISHEVLRSLHLPHWQQGAGAMYRPPGADAFALAQAFLGRRP